MTKFSPGDVVRLHNKGRPHTIHCLKELTHQYHHQLGVGLIATTIKYNGPTAYDFYDETRDTGEAGPVWALEKDLTLVPYASRMSRILIPADYMNDGGGT